MGTQKRLNKTTTGQQRSSTEKPLAPTRRDCKTQISRLGPVVRGIRCLARYALQTTQVSGAFCETNKKQQGYFTTTGDTATTSCRIRARGHFPSTSTKPVSPRAPTACKQDVDAKSTSRGLQIDVPEDREECELSRTHRTGDRKQKKGHRKYQTLEENRMKNRWAARLGCLTGPSHRVHH